MNWAVLGGGCWVRGETGNTMFRVPPAQGRVGYVRAPALPGSSSGAPGLPEPRRGHWEHGDEDTREPPRLRAGILPPRHFLVDFTGDLGHEEKAEVGLLRTHVGSQIPLSSPFPRDGTVPWQAGAGPAPGRALHSATPPWRPALPNRDPPFSPRRFSAPSQHSLLSFGVFSFRAGPMRGTFPQPRRGARPPPSPGKAEPPGPAPCPRPALTAPARSGPARLGGAGTRSAALPVLSRCAPGGPSARPAAARREL